MLQYFAHSNYRVPFGGTEGPRLLYVSKVDRQSAAVYPRAIHSHEAWFEMILVCGGSGQALIGEHMYEVAAGDILIYNSGVLHDEMCHAGLSFERLSLGLSGLRVEGLPENHLAPEGMRPVISTEGDGGMVAQSWNAIFELLSAHKPEAESIAHHLMLSILTFVQGRLNAAAVFPDVNSSVEHQLAMSVRGYLDAHYTETISLPDISRAMNLSMYHLAHVFKKIVGYAPMQYVAKRRIGEAQEKLIHTCLPITDIALGVGYNNVSSFNYAFSKFAGMSPSQFRNRYAAGRTGG